MYSITAEKLKMDEGEKIHFRTKLLENKAFLNAIRNSSSTMQSEIISKCSIEQITILLKILHSIQLGLIPLFSSSISVIGASKLALITQLPGDWTSLSRADQTTKLLDFVGCYQEILRPLFEEK